MKYLKAAVMLTLVLLLTGIRLPVATAQQGPQSQSSETVAKPKKKDVARGHHRATTTDADQPKIPTQYKKDKEAPTNLPTFRSDVTAVQVEVAVLDNKGHFIPNIPKDNFRVLEDNVPQQISTFSTNADAPMTIAMVIEFSNLFQRYWSQGWYETLHGVLRIRPDPEAGRLRRGGRVRHAARDSFRFHHGPDEDPGSHAALAHSRILGIEHVRRGGGHRAAHEQYRRTQSHPADRDRPRYVQQAYIRQSPQSHPGRRRADLRDQPPAGLAHHGGTIHGADAAHGLPASRQRDEHVRHGKPAARRSSRASSASIPASSKPSRRRSAISTPSPTIPPIRPRTESSARSKWSW